MKIGLVVFLAASSAAILSGCATPQKTWQKEGVSRDGAATAYSECKYQIGLNKVATVDREQLTKDCMQGKGFRLR